MARKKTKTIPKQKNKYAALTNVLVSGIIDITRSGMGYVNVQGFSQDVIVRSEDLNTAHQDDEVQVKITYVSNKGRAEGKVTKVLRRVRNEYIGTVEIAPNFAFLITDKSKLHFDIFLPLKNLNGAKNGDRAAVRITEWTKGKNPTGEIIEILNAERENQIAMKEILMDNGFPLNFSDDTLEEAARINPIIDQDEINKRVDYRDVLTFTIDPKDAKDFDDAISIKKLDGNVLQIGVHIADVSHYVQPGSPIDTDAYTRATSVYLPDRVLPMLPEVLSNEICSLRPNEDKLTFSAIFDITPQGKVKDYWLGRTVIRSDHRFTYEDAQTIIETGKGQYQEEILLLNKIAQSFREKRFKKGAINFSSQEVRFVLDEQGVPIDIEIKESKAAHQLIEELMLLANRTVAEYVGEYAIKGKPVPFPYRTHDVPNEEKLGVFAAFASRFGYKFNLNSPEKIAESFNTMLEKVQGKPEQHILEQLGIRTMSKALYTTENIGHYGLGFADYCHFTSPIRRYPDIMVHRILQQCLDQQVEPDKKLELKCRHCSERERKAMESERSANKYKQVELMQQFIGETFDAVISGVSSFGFWAETIAHKCEGLVGIDDLIDVDTFVFSESDYALIGMHTGKRFSIGDTVQVQVVATNLQKRQIDFMYVPPVVETKKASKKKSGSRKSKEK